MRGNNGRFIAREDRKGFNWVRFSFIVLGVIVTLFPWVILVKKRWDFTAIENFFYPSEYPRRFRGDEAEQVNFADFERRTRHTQQNQQNINANSRQSEFPQ